MGKERVILFTGKQFQDEPHSLHREGDAVAAKAQHKDGIGKIGMLTNIGQPVFGVTEGAGPVVIFRKPDGGEELSHLRDQGIGFLVLEFVGEAVVFVGHVFTPDKQSPVVGSTHINIRIARIPDQGIFQLIVGLSSVAQGKGCAMSAIFLRNFSLSRGNKPRCGDRYPPRFRSLGVTRSSG